MLVPKNPHYRVRADLPDWRDLPYHPQGNPLRPVVDLRNWASPVEDQEHLGACTGNAVVGAYELLMNRERPQGCGWAGAVAAARRRCRTRCGR